jgi:oligopeptide/dipeptide ABC transporter ATP-binding protein
MNDLLAVRDLKVYFRTGDEARPVKAVDGVSLTIREGETVALVGESGSGKSVTALSLARLLPGAAYVAGGSVRFEGEDVLAMDDRRLRELRGGRIAYIFQEPSTSLNPVFTVGWQIAEAVRVHASAADPQREAVRLMRLVGLPDPERRCRSYPHEMSGGMQQRVMIAMALACKPRLLVADEPTTALDVTIQAQILELLAELQQQLRMGILLITHNFGLVARMARFIHVMYAGRIVEAGPTRDVLTEPRHPYTKALLRAVPRLRAPVRELAEVRGSIPSLADLPAGCAFNPRCPQAAERCRVEEPAEEAAGTERTVRCHFWK